MYKTQALLSGAGAVANGTSFQMKDLDRESNFPVQITGITDATVRLEGSFDNSTFTPIQNTTVTADTCLTLPVAFPYIRAAVTVWVSGIISVYLGY